MVATLYNIDARPIGKCKHFHICIEIMLKLSLNVYMYNVPSPRGCVGVRIGTIPALIVEGDYQGPPLEFRGINI
jgi:hypothetical protein